MFQVPLRYDEGRTRKPATGLLQVDTSGLPIPIRLVCAAFAEKSVRTLAEVAAPMYPPGRQDGEPSSVSRSPRKTDTLEMPAVGSVIAASGSQATPPTQF